MGSPFMIRDPVLLSVLSASCYGAKAIFQKLSSQHIRPQQVQLWTAITSALFALTRWLASSSSSSSSSSSVAMIKTSGDLAGVMFAIASGFGSFAGTYFFVEAIGAGGDVGTVSAISASYPALVYLVSLVLFATTTGTEGGGGERMELHKVAGLGFAILSAVAFAYEPPPGDHEKIMVRDAITNVTTSARKMTEHIKMA